MEFGSIRCRPILTHMRKTRSAFEFDFNVRSLTTFGLRKDI